MADRHSSPTSDAPEAVPGQTRATFGFIGSDDYEYYEPPPSAFERQRSPVPEYQPEYEPHSARVSAASPPPPSSDVGRSPQLSDSGFSKSRPLSPSLQYSEIHSPDPQRVYNDPQGEKEAVYSPDPHHSKVPSYYAAPAPGIHHQDSADRPQVWSDASQQYPQEQQQRRKPLYKRWWFIVGIIFLIVAIAVAVPVGVVFGTKKHNNSTTPNGGSSGSSGASGTSGSGNPDTSVGGNLNAAYYSKAGAFNGSGIAIAAANTEYNQAIYAFYQDYTGALQYTLYDPRGQWNLVGPVNAGSYKALNGTPLSAVQHQLGDELRWHLFYIDENYIIRERVITNTSTTGPSPIWTDGPLSSQNLKTWQSDTIGLQACYWGNYYGQWSYNATQATAGIHIWYASDSTTFQQYSWTNGTNTWNFDQEWNDLSGNGGVGCQTWFSMTEYVWFVDTNNKLQMYWKDNNHSTTATSSHPINAWTSVDIGVSNVQKDSSLGYTNYMVWQDNDTSIKGAFVVWGAENTTINSTDTWTLQTNNANVKALRGTHLSVTAVSTGSNGALLQVFFQSTGNDMEQYNRDAKTPNALWSQAPAVPVAAPP